MMNVASSILTAAGKPRWTFFFVGPLVPLALLGHLLLIPRFGALGAASVTALCASLSAMAELVAVYRVWGVLPPLGTVGRSAILCVLAYVSAALWPTPGPLLFLKLPALALLVLAGYVLVGEFSSSEMAAARSLLPSRPLKSKKQGKG
jgi:O-antigen/teichoic acid export membrane protein